MRNDHHVVSSGGVDSCAQRRCLEQLHILRTRSLGRHFLYLKFSSSHQLYFSSPRSNYWQGSSIVPHPPARDMCVHQLLGQTICVSARYTQQEVTSTHAPTRPRYWRSCVIGSLPLLGCNASQDESVVNRAEVAVVFSFHRPRRASVEQCLHHL